MKKITKEILIRAAAYGVVFAITVLILSKTPLPNRIKEIMSTIGAETFEPPIAGEWATLFVYRICIYLAAPIVVSTFEVIFFKSKRNKYTWITNLEAQFLGFSIISGVFYLFSLDYVFKADIFTIKDSIIFLFLFIMTVVLDKRLPLVFMKEE